MLLNPVSQNGKLKDEVATKRHAGGIGVVALLSFLLFFGFGFSITVVEEIREILVGNITFSVMRDLILFLAASVFLLLYAFMYWNFNFIEIRNEMLNISYLDRGKRSVWPKFVKIGILLDDIKNASLDKCGFLGTPVMKIMGKNNKPYHIDTKPFTRATFWWLIKELEKKGIAVDMQKGSI